MTVIAGADGCPKGWLFVIKNLSNGHVAVRILPRIDDVLTLNPRLKVLAIDIPIGLTEAGPRQCDREARAKPGGATVKQRFSGSSSSNLAGRHVW